MVCARETDHIWISDHALKRFGQRRVQLGLDDFGSNLQLLEAELRWTFAGSTRLDVTSLRNWKMRKRNYPNSIYFRNERFVLVMSINNNTLVTCFLYQGRGATHRKPRNRDARARRKTALHKHLHEGKEL